MLLCVLAHGLFFALACLSHCISLNEQGYFDIKLD